MTDLEVRRPCGECASIELKSMMVFDNKTNDWKCEICEREKQAKEMPVYGILNEGPRTAHLWDYEYEVAGSPKLWSYERKDRGDE